MATDADTWALWPDGFMCPIGEIDEYLNPPCARSDDFERVIVTSYAEDGEPDFRTPGKARRWHSG